MRNPSEWVRLLMMGVFVVVAIIAFVWGFWLIRQANAEADESKK